jgi:uncharacterized membrane protein YhaH (DUF805 family)
MSFQDAVRTCLQQKFTDFTGRARRSEYWFFQLFLAIVWAVWVVGFAVFQKASVLNVIWSLLGIVVVVGLIVPSLAVFWRRLHDTDRAGWWWLLGFVPLGGLVLLVFTLLDSGPDNRYGPNPKGDVLPYSPEAPSAPPAPQF